MDRGEQMARCRVNKVRGFTLVEVMVSLVIFLIASMGLLPLLLTNLQVNSDNSLHAQARRLADAVMTELQVTEYARLTSVPGEPILVENIEIDQRIERNQPLPEQSRITVTARWQQRGRSHSYQLQTIRSAP